MTKHEEFLWELVLHESEMKSELTRLYFDCLTFIAKTEQLEAFQLHKKQREDSRRKTLEESCSMDEQDDQKC
ncbi:hypothetical protein [Paenibacillus apiarius]|uniref:hypothetical protein n=1 Tax=Paenibacillus apiarius TaxID=46240 RepID=UPI00197D53D5|nr:hypothetical protein [Paenibacillus apiarius]MBN3522636.1 hypothetical protein [Paenibacillus apiarius]